MLLPGVQLAILVDGALELVIAGGAIEIMAEIVFPRPVSLTGALTFCAMAAASSI